LLLGLAYKRNTGDARESPSQPVARRLVELGAEVLVADPHVDDHLFPTGVTRVDLTEDVIASASIVVVLVDHDAFDLDLVARAAVSILDTQHCLRGTNVEHL
jgi:UDP-N-acetyl-D-mannosaminuronate dehydrogenase